MPTTADWAARYSGNQGGSENQGGGNGGQGWTRSSSGNYDLSKFYDLRDQVSQANTQNAYNWWQQQQQQNSNVFNGPRQQNYYRFGQPQQDQDFGSSGFNYHKADFGEAAAAQLGEWGHWWNTLPEQLGGKDWKFDPTQFNLFDGVDGKDLTTVRNFAASLPGMIVGGPMEGVGKIAEAVTGKNLQKKEDGNLGGWTKDSQGNFMISDEQLDNSQRAAAFVDGAIDVAGSFTGGAAKIGGAITKGAARSIGGGIASGVRNKMMGELEEAGADKATKEFFDHGLKNLSSSQLTDIAKKMGGEYAEKAARLEKWEKRAHAFDHAGEGWLKKAGIDSKVANFGADVAKEASEEFVQSYMDDIRHENLDDGSLDRALLGAAWGAAGGGIMSGVGMGVNAVADKVHRASVDPDDQVSDPTMKPDPADDHFFERDRDRNALVTQSGTQTRTMKQKLIEQQREANDVPASTSQYNTFVDDSLDLTEHGVGDQVFHAMLVGKDRDQTLNMLSTDLGATEEEILDADATEDEGERVAKWKGMVQRYTERNGRPPSMDWGRYPKTSALTAGKFDLVDVFPGRGHSMNRIGAMVFGGDQDGDKMGAYFPDVDGNTYTDSSYLTRFLIPAIRKLDGKQEGIVDTEYFSFLQDDSNKAIKGYTTAYRQTLVDTLMQDYGIPVDEARSIAKKAATSFYKALANRDSETRTYDVLKALDTSRGMVERELKSWAKKAAEHNEANPDDQIGIPSLDMGYISDKVIARGMQAAHLKAVEMPQTFESVFKRFDREGNEIADKVAELVDERDTRFLRYGDAAGNVKGAQVAAILGDKVYANTGINLGQNPFMRQDAARYYVSKADQRVLFDKMTNAEIRSVFDDLIAFSFKLSEVGGHVETALEGIFRTAVIDDVMASLGADFRIGRPGTYAEFMQTFVETYNRYAVQFNESLKELGTDHPVYKSAQKSKLAEIVVKDGEVVNNDLTYVERFMDVFGYWEFGELFDISRDSKLFGMRIEAGAEEFAISGGNDPFAMGNVDGMKKVWPQMIKKVRTKADNVGRRIEDLADTVSDLALKMHVEEAVLYDENVGINIVRDGDLPMMLDFLDGLNALFEDVFDKNGKRQFMAAIGEIENFINTKWGEELMSGDRGRTKNAVLAIRLTNKYDDVISILAEKESRPTWQADLEHALKLHANDSLTDALIYQEAERFGFQDAELLRMLTSLDVSYEVKYQLAGYAQDGDTVTSSLMADAFSSGDTALGTSQIVNRIEKSKRAFNRAERQATAINIEVLNKIVNSKMNDVEKVRALKDLASESSVEISIDSVAAFVHSQMDIVKEMTDKGVSGKSSDILFQLVMQSANGNLMSYLDEADMELGNMQMGNFRTNRRQIVNVLLNPDRTVRLWDPSESGYVYMSRDSIFEAVVGRRPRENWDTSFKNWEDLMRACPSLVSMFTPSRLTATTNEGQTTVNDGMAKTLDKAMEDWMEDHRNERHQIGRAANRARIEQLLFRNPNWWSVFTASIAGLPYSSSPSQTKHLVKKALAKHVDFIEKVLSMEPDGEAYSLCVNNYKFNSITLAVDTLDDLLESTAMVGDIMRQVAGDVNSASNVAVQHALNFTMQMTALMDMDGELVPYMDIDLGDDALDYGGFREWAKAYGEDIATLVKATLSLLDLGDIDVSSIYASTGFRAEINSTYDNMVTRINEDEYLTQQKKQVLVDKVNEHRTTVNDIIDNGDLASMMRMIGHSDVADIMETAEGHPDIIPPEAVTDWSEQQFLDAVEKICNDTNNPENFNGKAKKAIHKAFEKRDQNPGELRNIRQHYNQYIVTEFSNRIMFGKGVEYNPLAAKQKMNARQLMLEVSEDIRKDFLDRGIKIEPSDKPLPDIDFAYDDPVLSYAATAAQMNAQSGSIPTGINMDGAVMKAVAMFGMLDDSEPCGVDPVVVEIDKSSLEEHVGYANFRNSDGNMQVLTENAVTYILANKEDYADGVQVYPYGSCLTGACHTCSPRVDTSSKRGRSYHANLISAFVNWMQEPLHLKLKKALGAAEDMANEIARNPELDKTWSMEELRALAGDDATNLDLMKQALYGTRRKLADEFWGPRFKDGPEFKAEDAQVISAITTPMMEVEIIVMDENGIPVVNDDGEPVTQVRYVSSANLTTERFMKNYGDPAASGFIAEGAIVSVHPVPMSLQEVAAKMTREITDYVYDESPQGKDLNKKDLKKRARRAFEDWDGYNDRSSISIKGVMQGVASRDFAAPSNMTADMNYTPVINWENDFEGLKRRFDPRPSRETKVKRMDSKTQERVFAGNLMMRNGLIYPNDHVIVRITGEKLQDSQARQTRPLSVMLTGSEINGSFSDELLGNQSTIIGPKADGEGSKPYQCVEMYMGDSASAADTEYKHALKSGRKFAVKASLLADMKVPDRFDRDSAEYFLEVPNGRRKEQYVTIDPNISSFYRAKRRENIVIPVTEFDPNSVTVAVASYTKLGLPDAAHLVRQGFKTYRPYHERNSFDPALLLNTGENVDVVTDREELGRIDTDELDVSYYSNMGVSTDVIKDKAKAFIDRDMTDGGDGHLMVQRGVKRGDVIGFVRSYYLGNPVYAPIVYDGSVPPEADVYINGVSQGLLTIDMLCDDVDYQGNESMKLGLFGVAYKTVGRVASDEAMQRWAALYDGSDSEGRGGFDLFTLADFLFDGYALGGRVFDTGDKSLQNNVFFYTRRTGVNLFFKLGRDGTWRLRDDLDITESQMIDLMNGIGWDKVASGRMRIFKSPDESKSEHYRKLNDDIAKLSNEMYTRSASPHLFFNSMRIGRDENGEWEPVGLERRSFDPRIACKYMSTDSFLRIFSHLDERLVPPDMQTDPDADGTITTVFDQRGRMLDMNTLSGKPERVPVVVGPNFYTGQGTAMESDSTSASWAPQAILKSLLDTGIYERSIRDTVDLLATTVGRVDGLTQRSEKERVDKLAERNAKKTAYVNTVYTRRAERILDDNPIVLDSISRYREKLSKVAQEFTRPLKIRQDNSEKLYNEDEQSKERVARINAELNRELFGDDLNERDKLDQGLISLLVRMQVGWTDNEGRGMNGLTVTQYVRAVEAMIKNVKNGEPVIKGGRYSLGTTKKRVSICLLPHGVNIRLAQSKHYKNLFPDAEGPAGIVAAMEEEQRIGFEEASKPEIERIEDAAKRNELWKLADSVCFVNKWDLMSGHLLEGNYIIDIIEADLKFGTKYLDLSKEELDQLNEAIEFNSEYMNKMIAAADRKQTYTVDMGDGTYKVMFKGNEKNIVTTILRSLAAERRAIGMLYAEMLPANLIERSVKQGQMSLTLKLGRTIPGGLYRARKPLPRDLVKAAARDPRMKKLYAAYREAQLLGVDRELMVNFRNLGDIDQAIEQTFRQMGKFESIMNKIMNTAAGQNVGISTQIENFIDRFAQRAETEAPWWHRTLGENERTLIEEQLSTDPAKWFSDVMAGRGEGNTADMLLARQSMEWSKQGDMAQKHLMSMVWSEIAAQSAGKDFLMTTLGSPYFSYATGRLGRLLNWIAPISSLHYVAVEFFTKGPGKDWKILGAKGTTFGDLGLEEAQVYSSLQEAIKVDMMRIGVSLTTTVLMGLALSFTGVLEPPEDDKKKGNFKEWTFFGMHVDEAWWIEDVLGLTLPAACFGVSVFRGEPRLDLLGNGLMHYLSNNPVVKVSDAVSFFFDPLDEFYKEYDQDMEGYAKAMGGPPSMSDIMNGKMTSFGLGYVAQFITPGIIREIYNDSQKYEKSYKRVFDTDATGQMTQEGDVDNKTEYTSYSDAVLRKFTRNNPVMGLLADLVIQPETGYRADEMPNNVIYEPAQMNSMQVFSLYEDPWTKQQPRPLEEQLSVAYQAIALLQGSDVDDLYQQGFFLDYDTKKFIGQIVWDNIATMNSEWADLEQSGALEYKTAGDGDWAKGQKIVSEMKEQHFAQISYWKSFYYDKLWNEKFNSMIRYNQLNTDWAQDSEGNWYATGWNPQWWKPIDVGLAESPDTGWQQVMSAGNDWQSESVLTGEAIGTRGLVPTDMGNVDVPDLESNSEDGTDTGHSSLYGKLQQNGLGNTTASDTSSDGGYSKSGGYRRRGGGGGYSRGGGGGGYAKTIYAPNISLPNLNASRTMNTDRQISPQFDYLRPNFETKGSREAYKRSDI